MPRSTTELRKLWSAYECKADKMVVIPFGPDRIRIAPPSADAWQALATVLDHHGYLIRTTDTDSYNCRSIKGGKERSLHAFGIALDVNWTTNPYRDHAGKREVRYSAKPTQDERAEETRLAVADTDMTKAMIDDVTAIRTVDAKPIFDWGGDWDTLKDTMHFQIAVGPAELEKGVDWTTVAGEALGDAAAHDLPHDDKPVAIAPDPVAAPTAQGQGEPNIVIARTGLNLRGGPSTEFEILRSLPPGARVFVLGRAGSWAKIDLQNDGLVDGFAAAGFLKSEIAITPPASPFSGGGVTGGRRDITGSVTPALAKTMFPSTPIAPIKANLDFVLEGLRALRLGDRDMVLMALATIRAETEGFVPVPEGRSRFNTKSTPFDLYDAGTKIGRGLGNTRPGDGPAFRGRGYVQLTGRDNYTRIGAQIGAPILAHPEEACDPTTAGLILAQFLKNAETTVRKALANDDLKAARKAVNGGSHGLDRFTDAYRRGQRTMPA